MINLFKYIDRINRLNGLLISRSTGTPAELSKRLGISQIRLHQILENLRIMGLEVEYCRTLKTYYYKNDCELNILVNLKTSKMK